MDNFDRLNYDPKTGVFTWAKSNNNRIRVGDVAGWAHGSGYVCVQYDGVSYLAHRLAWYMNHGKWPDFEIDHINGNKLDNRIENLRDVSRSVNKQNQRTPRLDNKTGFLGVSWYKSRNNWVSQIEVNGKHVHLGYFDDPKTAHNAYLNAKRKLHEGCTI